MTVKFDIEILNQEQVLKNLKQLDFAARRRGVTRSVNKAAAPMVKLVRVKSLPRRTGALWKSIRRTSSRLDRRTGTVKATISSRSTKSQRQRGFDAFYAHMVVGGTKAHRIQTSNKKALSDGRQIFGRAVSHPGYRGRDFFEQAFRSGSRNSTTVFGRELDDQITQEINKLPQ